MNTGGVVDGVSEAGGGGGGTLLSPWRGLKDVQVEEKREVG